MLKLQTFSIHIKNLRIPTVIGVYDYERFETQELILNLELKIRENGISFSDHLCDTVDYGAVARRLYSRVSAAQSHLLEHLAQIAVSEVFEVDERICSVDLEIFKTGCIENADGAVVKMCFTRE